MKVQVVWQMRSAGAELEANFTMEVGPLELRDRKKG